jgi:hypothetical protein
MSPRWRRLPRSAAEARRGRVGYGKKASTAFLKKSSKKHLSPQALEWPRFGRSKAGGDKSFLARSPRALFFKKALLLLGFLSTRGALDWS